VRSCGSLEDLYRRTQTAMFSPQAVFNAWFLKNPPWLQIDRDKNNNDELLPERDEVEAVIRRLTEQRMSFIPYLYSAFADYFFTGTPPFRALVMDYPEDAKTYNLDDEYMMGGSMLVAPMFAGQKKRTVYLPKGDWYCYWTHKKYAGGNPYEIESDVERIPLFVKGGTLLPLAKPVEWVGRDTVFEVTVNVFGESPEKFVLYEDDGVTLDFERGRQNRVTLEWTPEKGGAVTRAGGFEGKRYSIVEWVIAGQ
jgi:alpha-D-xyloside xylohydrolase